MRATALIFPWLVGITSAQDVILGAAGNMCPGSRLKVNTKRACREARRSVTTSATNPWNGLERTANWPTGCYHCHNVQGCEDGTWFNKHQQGSAHRDHDVRLYCAAEGWTGCRNGGCSRGGGFGGGRGITGPLLAGDSDIERWPNTASSFPGSVNVGVGGWTCKKLKRKIGGFLGTYNPAWVILVCGENDLWGSSAATTFNDFKAVVQEIHAAGARVVYVGTKPEPSTTYLHAKYREYDALIRAHAASLAAAADSDPPLVMVDSYKGFEDLGNPKSLYNNDRLHLSRSGYGHWTAWTQQALAQSDTACEVWQSGACTQGLQPVHVFAAANTACPAALRVPTIDECLTGARSLYTPPGDPDKDPGRPKSQVKQINLASQPQGCFRATTTDKLYFNTNKNGGWKKKKRQMLCKVGL